MMPASNVSALGTRRKDFYRETYFPAIYYAEVFKDAYAETQNEVQAQAKLQDRLIDAQGNLARLSETFRERQPGPGQAQALVQARYNLDQLAGQRAGALAATQGRVSRGLGSDVAERVRAYAASNPGLPAAKLTEYAGKELAKDASKVRDPAIARALIVDATERIRTATGVPLPFTVVEPVIQAQAWGRGQSLADVQRQAATAEDKKAVASYAQSGGKALAEVTPQEVGDRALLDAARSPYANGQLDNPLSSDEDELLQLYLQALQDRDSPGVVTDAEIKDAKAAGVDLARGEAIYKQAQASGSYLKSQAEWFAAEYLGAIRTQADLERKIKDGPTITDPYQEAQRRALKRGGYSEADVVKMQLRGSGIEKYVDGAYARARDGVDPTDDLEKIVRAAWLQSGKRLTVGELEGLLRDKKKDQVQAIRGVTTSAAAKIKGKQQVRNLYDNAGIEDAKTYLLALGLAEKAAAKGKKVEPEKVVHPIDPVAVKDPVVQAEKAAAAAKQEVNDLVGPEPVEPPQPAAPTPVVDELEDLVTKPRIAPKGVARRAPAPTAPVRTAAPVVAAPAPKYPVLTNSILQTKLDEAIPGSEQYDALLNELMRRQAQGTSPASQPAPVPAAPAPQPAPIRAQGEGSKLDMSNPGAFKAGAVQALKRGVPPATISRDIQMGAPDFATRKALYASLKEAQAEAGQ